VRPQADFAPRNGLDRATLLELFAWSEDEFLARTRSSAIRRIGYRRWLRNLAVALGNAGADGSVHLALRGRADHADAIVRDHVALALSQRD
jgi:epoxyqueuosine reductase